MGKVTERVGQPSRVQTFPLGEDLVVWSEGGDRLFVLNATARLIWEEHHAGQPTTAITDRLARRFAVPPRQAQRDTRAVLARWRQAGLLGGTSTEAPQTQKEDETQERLPPLPPPVAEQTYRLGGSTLRVRHAGAGLTQILQPLLRHLAVTPAMPATTVFDLAADPTGAGYLLGQDGRVLARHLSRDDLIAHTLYHLLAHPCQSAPTLAVLHAAAVANGDSCLVMAAPGGSGKTTLTAALLAEGWDYLGDDMILLSRDDPPRAWPLPGPLCLKAGSWPVLQPYYPDLNAWPVLQRWDQPVRYLPPPRPTPERAWPIRSLVFPSYRPGRSATLEPLTASAALQALSAANAQWRRPLGAGDIGLLAGWLEHTPAYRLSYEKLSEAVAAVRVLSPPWIFPDKPLPVEPMETRNDDEQ